MKALPVVKDSQLIIGGEVNPIGSAAWAKFLAEASSFRYERGEESITIRRDRGDLWSAYKKRQGKLYRAYVGNLADKLPTEITDILAGALAAMDKAYTKDVEAGVFAERKSEVEKLREALAEKDAIIKNLTELLMRRDNQPGEQLTAIAS
ncbi:hypothetical protein [Calothrix sp. NIES-2098]|uniref:hypothetical protein n=1 Tax=Calothrix sp. NIES-2098 TaxID=1954171 RepID=UPI000B5EC63D|nr:hypothetical protein NIES2098_41990 [Calothrix sp. NIES-2098]